MLCQLGSRFDAGQAAAHHRDGSVRRQIDQGIAQPLCAFQIGDRIGEFGCAAHRRHGAGAAHGVDEVVVVERGARRQPHPPVGGLDAVSAVDDQLDAATEQRAVIDGGCAAAGDQLVQPDALDEDRARVHQGDVDVGTQAQVIGGHSSGVSAANDDDASFLVVLLCHGCLLFWACALKTPQAGPA